jgi:ABC-2 type transport system ATP-binding protein
LGQTGKTIIVSSHILPELADVCNKIGIIDRGQMSVSAAVTDVMQQVRDQTILHIGIVGDESKAIDTLQENALVESAVMGDGYLVVTLKEMTQDYASLSSALVEAGLGINLFREEEINLESAFMALTRGTSTKM